MDLWDNTQPSGFEKKRRKCDKLNLLDEILEETWITETVRRHFPEKKNHRSNNLDCGVILIDKTKTQVLIIQEKASHKWGVPKGKREESDPKKTAWRECREEIGLDLDTIEHRIINCFQYPELKLYVVHLTETPNIKLGRTEIASSKWVDIDQFIGDYNMDRNRHNKYNVSIHKSIKSLTKLYDKIKIGLL
jgi:8-oxo-dGTP pyrophosphatase MutT (NUDIX family)